MKKMILTLACCLAALTAAAQYRPGYRIERPRTVHAVRTPAPAPPVRSRYASRYGGRYASGFHYNDAYFGLRLGLGLASVRTNDPYLDGGRVKAGLNIGAVGGFQIGRYVPLYLETGLYYLEKGGRGRDDGYSFTYGLHYLEVPLLFKYRIDVTPWTSVQPFAGVYGAVGVAGHIKDFGLREAYSSFDDEGFRRWDGGLRLGLGLQWRHLYAEMAYDVGLANISHDYFDDVHTGCFTATVGVNF
ncbi:MAG: PorT family protein [Bacteroidaceae bacterium]|nr:PorT family protein [Bacteroidaceae bacterium]